MEPGFGQGVRGAADDVGRAHHARLIDRDPTAPSDLVVSYLSPLVDWLLRTYPRHDGALLETVAIDLLLDVGRRPEQYDPDRLSLFAYLRMAARRDVTNALEKERRRAAHQVPWEDVELRPPARNSTWTSASDPADAVIEVLDREKVLAMREQFDDRDWACVLLILDGERHPEPFAALLGLHDRPREEQGREVKRAKDRLKKKLRRLWSRQDDDA
jgi:hypothetical protein